MLLKVELEGRIIFYLPVDGQSGIHQRTSGIQLFPVVDGIQRIRSKALGPNIFLRSVAGKVRDNHAKERFGLILRHMLPGGHIARLERIRQTVVVAFDDERIELAELAALFLADSLFFL